MIKGSCMCGKVNYAIKGQLSDITHCHCTTCRKAHGSAFSSVAAVQITDFEFCSGEELIKSYQSSAGKFRYFCSNCGSQLYAQREGQAHYILRLGTLNDDPKVKPTNHIWLSQKAPWYDIDSDCNIARYEQWANNKQL